jgi:hypothetical protein
MLAPASGARGRAFESGRAHPGRSCRHFGVPGAFSCTSPGPGDVRSDKAEAVDLIADSVEVLLNPVLDHFRPMPHRAEVRIDPSDHVLRSAPKIATHGVEAHRGTAVECLQSGGAVGVSEQPRPGLPLLPPRSSRHPVEALPGIHQHRLRSLSDFASVAAYPGRQK